MVSIRGLGQTDFNLAVEPGVGIYVDDVYFGTIYGSVFKLLDLDRVEVLRGPQGTLAGKNSEGGAIKLFSKEPTGNGGGYIEATYGSFNHREIRAGADWTLIPDTLFMRVSGVGDYRDGYVKRYDYQCFTGKPPITNFNAGNVGPFSPGGTSLNFVPGSTALGGPGGCQIGADGGISDTALRVAVRYAPSERLQDTFSYDTTMNRKSGPPASVVLGQGTIYGPGYNLLGRDSQCGREFFGSRGELLQFRHLHRPCRHAPGQYAYNPTNSLDAWGLSNKLVAELGRRP